MIVGGHRRCRLRGRQRGPRTGARRATRSRCRNGQAGARRASRRSKSSRSRSARPLPGIEAGLGESGAAYGSALCLVRLHGQPLGIVEVELPPSGLEPDLAGREHRAGDLGEAITRHLSADGLDAGGSGSSGIAERRAAPLSAGARGVPRAGTVRLSGDPDPRPPRAAPPRRSTRCSRCDYPADRLRGDRRRQPARRRRGPRRRARPARWRTSGSASCTSRCREAPTPATRGLARGRGEIVVFTDDDVVADRDLADDDRPRLRRRRRVGAVSGLSAARSSRPRPRSGSRATPASPGLRAPRLRPRDPPARPTTPLPLRHRRPRQRRQHGFPASKSCVKPAVSTPPSTPRRSPGRTSRRCCGCCCAAGGRARARRDRPPRPPARVPGARAPRLRLRARAHRRA